MYLNQKLILSPEDKEKLRIWVKDYIQSKCIIKVEPGEPLMLGKSPGTKYAWQFYLRRGLFNPEFMEKVSLLFLDEIQEKIGHFNFQLSGLETAATPLLIGIPATARKFDIDIPAFSVRKTRKEYGKFNFFEGEVQKDLPVLLLDDLCNTGGSIRTAMNTIYAEEKLGFLNCALSIVGRYSDPLAYEKRFMKGFQVFSLFSWEEFGLVTTNQLFER